MAGLVSISENLRALRVHSMAAHRFFDMSQNMQWPNLHTLEIGSLILGGTAITFFQDDYLENAVDLVTTISKAVSRINNIHRLDLQQRLWRYYDDIWDLNVWAWMSVEFTIKPPQNSFEATVAELRIRGVEPEVEAIEAWEDAITKDRAVKMNTMGFCDESTNSREELILDSSVEEWSWLRKVLFIVSPFQSIERGHQAIFTFTAILLVSKR